MNATVAQIPSPLAAKQALRLRRFGFAALNYVLATMLAAVAWAFGVLPGAVVVEAAAAFVAFNLAIYAVLRSGLNLRAADPSLTGVQMAAAISILMYLVYHMDQGYDIALFGCFIVFLFGIFRLRVRDFVGITVYTLALYALVIVLRPHFDPGVARVAPSQWMSWIGLAGFLPCFVVIGGQINALRNRMRAGEAILRSQAEMSSDFYWETDAQHRIVGRGASDEKRGTASIFRREVRIGERRWDVPSMSPGEEGWQAHRAVLDAHLPFRDFENSRLGTDGTERHISLSGDPFFDASGTFSGYRGVGSDITARKRIKQRLRDSSRHLRLFIENIPVMTISLDSNLRCLYANRLYATFFGLESGAIVGRHLRELVGEEVYGEIAGHFAQALAGYPTTYERESLLPGGEPRFLEVKVLPNVAEDGSVQGCFSVVTDITEHKRAEEHSRSLAHYDSLTGLPNRLLFGDRLSHAIALSRRDAQPFALLFLDLDKFKPVNDAHGHAAGDELLKTVATRIRLQVRESDTVARIGGDEFTVILPGVGIRAEAEGVARKIAAALAAPFELGNGVPDARIGTSIGIAIFPEDATDPDALIKVADAAMYRAKHAAPGSIPAAA